VGREERKRAREERCAGLLQGALGLLVAFVTQLLRPLYRGAFPNPPTRPLPVSQLVLTRVGAPSRGRKTAYRNSLATNTRTGHKHTRPATDWPRSISPAITRRHA